MTTENAGTAGLGLSEAASRIQAIFSPKEDPTPADKGPASNAAATKVEATAADDAADETPPSDTDEDAEETHEDIDGTPSMDDEDGAAADEATDDDEGSDDEPEADDPLYTVKINGKEEKVSLKEALNGYSRTADYTRKAQALADDKKSFATEKQAVSLERQQYAQLLPILVETIKQSMAEPDWEALAENPKEYIRAQRLWGERNEKIAAALQEQDRLNSIKESEAAAQRAEEIRTSGAELIKYNADWAKPDKWAAARAKLIEYGVSQGFSEEELKNTSRSGAIIALHKAMKYDAMMANRPKPTPSNGPKPASAGTPKPAAKRQVSEITRAKQRLAKTGRVKDAATIFEKLLG